MDTIRLLALDDRPVTAGGGITSRHGLSFGAHYDPERTAFGALVAHNVDVLAPGVSYGEHSHRDVEIVTWVLSGAMRHRGPDGREDVVVPGVVQHLAAGTGWRHDERAEPAGPLHLVQCWVAPGPDDPAPGPPSLAHVDVSADLESGRPVLLASGEPGARAAVTLRRAGTALTAVRVAPGATWTTDVAGWVHLFVARGAVTVEGHAMRAAEGDTVEGRGTAVAVAAARDGAEVLAWTTDPP